MKELLKWGALAAAAYIVYQQLTGANAAAAQPSGSPANQPASTNPPVTTAASTRQLLLAAAGTTAASFHQWNFAYRSIYPSAATPAPEAVGMGDGTAAIDVDTYLAAIARVGLSGIVRRWRA